jgi:hypothetical protein
MLTKQGAWGLWWLCLLTVSIYYLVWYQRTNRELCAMLGREAQGNGKWWSQFIPFYAGRSRRATARRLNDLAIQLGSPTRVAPWTFSMWSLLWFGSHTRYLQRRINILHDVMAAHAAHGTPVTV